MTNSKRERNVRQKSNWASLPWLPGVLAVALNGRRMLFMPEETRICLFTAAIRDIVHLDCRVNTGNGDVQPSVMDPPFANGIATSLYS